MSNGQGSSFALGVLVGAVIGGGLALLYAPKSGKETREYIRDKSGDLYEVIKRKVTDARQTVGEKIAGEECFPPKKDVEDVIK
jgi:gas vesicle protein